MKNSIKLTLACVLITFIGITSAHGEVVTFIKEYTYQASEFDSKASSRILALEQIKKLLLQELGTYLISETEVKNYRMAKDQITVLTAGIVRTEIIAERWDGRIYWLKSKIVADSDEVTKSIDTLRKDRAKTKALEEVRKRSDELLKENENLRKELTTAKDKRKQEATAAYDKTINELSAVEWVERGLAPADSELWSNAAAMKEAIYANSKAIEIDPNFAEAYNLRGLAYDMLDDHKQAIKDYNKAIALNPKFEWAYLNRSMAHHDLGNETQAIKDMQKAEELSLKDVEAYYQRGLEYYSRRNYIPAIQDFDKAIDLNPKYADAYNSRAAAYNALGNNNHAINDLKIAARLGLKSAQDYLKEKGIDW